MSNDDDFQAWWDALPEIPSSFFNMAQIAWRAARSIDALSHSPEGWQPLPPPSAGTYLAGSPMNVGQAKWKPRLGKWTFPSAGMAFTPTHWMPLPAAPEAPPTPCKGCSSTPCHCDPRDPCAAARRGGYEEA